MIQEPGLQLDDRQRAMLEAMHIKVWQPPARSVARLYFLAGRAETKNPPSLPTRAVAALPTDRPGAPGIENFSLSGGGDLL